jgi:hypothetical protein
MNTKKLLKNIPNEIFDDEYVTSNHILFDLYKEEYSLTKYLRKRVLAAEILNSEDLEINIREELAIYDVGTLGGKQYVFGEVTNMLGTMLNTFDEENNNNFNGYTELEQYHTISGTIHNMLPELIMGKIISSKN